MTSCAHLPWTFTLQVLACMPQLLHLLRAEGLHASKANRQQEAHVLRKALSALGSNSCDDVPRVSALGNDQVSGLELWRVMYFWAIFAHLLQPTIKSCEKEYQGLQLNNFHQNNDWTKYFICYTSDKKKSLQNCRPSCTCADTKDEALELNRKVWRAPPAVGPEVLFTSANSPSRCCHSFHLQEIGNGHLQSELRWSKNKVLADCGRPER